MTASDRARTSPVASGERITALDAIRGVAVLGILTMNAVSYGLPDSYFNLDSAGTETWLDWLIGGAGEIFFDQKFMGLFSMLFGAGIVLFADRAASRLSRPGWLSLWRNTLLLIIGIVHTLFWVGDILKVYAVCAPLLILLRRRRPVTLIVAGTLIVASAAVSALVVQSTINDPANQIGDGYWLPDGKMSDAVGLWFLYDFFARSLGMMLIGVALYRTGVITGQRSAEFYKRVAKLGLGIGLPLAALGLALVAGAGFSADVALAGSVPNTAATIPIALGYLALIALWDARAESKLRVRIRAVGRMALTNYLTQTVIGLVVLRLVLDPSDVTRTLLVVFILAVWAVQLWWSQAWLSRFRYGPAEWLWRCATYWRWHPLRTTQ